MSAATHLHPGGFRRSLVRGWRVVGPGHRNGLICEQGGGDRIDGQGRPGLWQLPVALTRVTGDQRHAVGEPRLSADAVCSR